MFDSRCSALRPGLVLTLGLVAAVLVGCGSLGKVSDAGEQLVESLKPYRITVVQGNVVTREQVNVLKPGMSRIQVRDILGTPLLASVFHTDRWDYVFTFRRQGSESLSRRVTVFFKGDLLERFEADEGLPTESEFAATLAGNSKPVTAPVLEATPERLEQSRKNAPPPAAPADPVALPPLPASYPPLEPVGR